MEDERVGSIYLEMMRGFFARLWSTIFPRGLSRSPLLPFIFIAIFVIVPGIVWRLHRLGSFHAIKSEIKGDSGVELPRPGGMDAIVLSVPLARDANVPQFTTVTLLPGLGTSILQITANLPGQGPATLLTGPSVDDLANGQAEAPAGFNDDHGAIEFPWGGELAGAITPVGSSISIPWQTKQLEASTEASAHSGIAEGGMLWTQSADTVTRSPAGDAANSLYHGINGERWPSKNDAAVSAKLTPAALIITLDVKNSGDVAEPVGAGWHPRFALSAGARRQTLLQLPSGSRMQLSAAGLPTGTLMSTDASDRFISRPEAIGSGALDATIVNPKSKGDATITLLNPAAGYGIRLVPLSSSIKALRVNSPEDSSYIALGVQTNLDDPFGHQWAGANGGGMVILEPGETLQFKVRLEIFAVPKP